MPMNRPRQAGFTLIEVMVAVFVVAIGLLTAAGLQVVSKKATFDALQRTAASLLAQEMVERIRSNEAAVEAYYNQDAQPSNVVCDSGNACTRDQLVAYDFAQWHASLQGASETIVEGETIANAGGLRTPVACVRPAGGSDWIEVIIEWRGLSKINQTPDAGVPDDPFSASCGDPQDDWELDAASNQSYRRVLRLQAHIAS